MNSLIAKAGRIPALSSVQTLSISPIRLQPPFRSEPLDLRVTAPVEGKNLPILLLSHGHGPSLYLSSKDGYGPLANFYAEQGFVVIQPTHASSRVAGLPQTAPGAPLFWRMRVMEMTFILDQLDSLEAAVPALSGRLDQDRVAAVGHSLGGQTVGMLLGARLTDPNDANARDVDMIEPRIKAGVLLGAPGRGGANLSDMAREKYSALNPDFSKLVTRCLAVVGDNDVNPYITVRGPEWYRAVFEDSPGCKHLMTVTGGTHGFGGIAGYDAKETSDEDPDRLAVVQRMTAVYLRSALYDTWSRWDEACRALAGDAAGLAHIEAK